MKTRKEIPDQFTQLKPILLNIATERYGQINKFGNQKNVTDLESLSIVMEELGEVAKIVTKRSVRPINQRELELFTVSDLKKEILQTATCLVAWYERLTTKEKQ